MFYPTRFGQGDSCSDIVSAKRHAASATHQSKHKFAPRGDAHVEQWAGGVVLVFRDLGGWAVKHIPEAGPAADDWWLTKAKALSYAKARAAHFDARVFEEVKL